MPTESSYERVRAAAERRQADDSSTTWKLADAVLAQIPEMPSGTRTDLTPPAGGGSISDRLAILALQLAEDGARTPGGDEYTAAALKHLREMAMAWRPSTTRHDEAAYETHREANGPDTAGGTMLAALCAVARGERVRRPEVGEVGPPSDRRVPDKAAWDLAVAGIRRKQDRPRPPRYLVAKRDFRTAMLQLDRAARGAGRCCRHGGGHSGIC